MAAATVERKLTAILSADVKGYSRLMGADEVGTLRTLTAHREVTDSLIQQHRGRIVGTAGDSVLTEFASAVDAVRCAVEIQQALKTKNAQLSLEQRMEFRIGINVGDVIVEGPQIYGEGVNIAARLEALADAGGICISGTVYDQVENKLTLGYEYLGEQIVKNIAKPVRVYRVVAPEVVASVQASRDETALLLPLPDKPSIVVLPFVNMSGDLTQEHFSDGLTEILTSDLSKLSGLFVISRNSAFFYKGKAVKMQEVSKELGVRYVLEGSVLKAGDRVRITTQLIDATRDHHLWSERYDRPLGDIFALQDEIVQQIVTKLQVEVLKAELERARRVPTQNLTAYDSFLRGVSYWVRTNKEANLQARQMFEKAIELDPEYAEAYARLGWTYFIEWLWQWNADSQILGQALALGQKAIALKDSLALGHALLGAVYLWTKRNEQAVAAQQQAILHDPNNATAYGALAEALSWSVRPLEAIGMAQQALRLNPLLPVGPLFELGLANQFMGQHEQAITAYKKALSSNPYFEPARMGLAGIYGQLGREEEARAEAGALLKMNPNFSVELWRQRFPAKDPAVAEWWIDGLRKAGLK
jgi:adenylate cyclase